MALYPDVAKSAEKAAAVLFIVNLLLILGCALFNKGMHELLQERKASFQAVEQLEEMVRRLRASEKKSPALFEALAIQITRHAYRRHYLSSCDPAELRLSMDGTRVEWACAWQFPTMDGRGTLRETFEAFGSNASVLFLDSMNRGSREQRLRELIESTFDQIGRASFSHRAMEYMLGVVDWRQAVAWIVSSDNSFDRATGFSGGFPVEMQTTRYFGQFAVTPLQELSDELERFLVVLPAYSDAETKLISTIASIRERLDRTKNFNVSTALPGSMLPLSVSDLLPMSPILILFLYLRVSIIWEEKRLCERGIAPESQYFAFPAYRVDLDRQHHWVSSRFDLLQRVMWFSWLILPILVLYLSILFRFNVVVPFELPYPHNSLLGNVLAVRSYDPISITIDYLGLFCLFVVLIITMRLTSGRTESFGSYREYIFYLVLFVLATAAARLALWVLTSGSLRDNDPRSAGLNVFAVLCGIVTTFMLIGYRRGDGFTFVVCAVSLMGLAMVFW